MRGGGSRPISDNVRKEAAFFLGLLPLAKPRTQREALRKSSPSQEALAKPRTQWVALREALAEPRMPWEASGKSTPLREASTELRYQDQVLQALLAGERRYRDQ